MLNIIMFGAPGSGKGTQSDLIVEACGLNHISTGELLREEIAKQTDKGRKIDELISKGNLAPDDMIMEILFDRLEHFNGNTKGIVFDGIPRTLNQAVAFEKMMNQLGKPVTIMIDIDVPREILIDRLLYRGQNSGRSDDNMEVIKHRFEVYEATATPVKNFYQSIGKYVAIDGIGSMEEVFQRIQKVLAAYL